MYSTLALDLWTPRQMMNASLEVMQLSAEAFKFLLPGKDNRVLWQEFKNKLQAFDLFENVDTVLGLNSNISVPLWKLLEQAYALDAYRALWITEGLGHYHTEMYWERIGTPRGLLRGAQIQSVPAKSLTALHAGMGLSLSNRLLKTVGTSCSDSEVFDVLQQFIELCADNAEPGYVGAANEALGLTTRNLYPQLIPIIDRQLQKFDEKFVSYFWHGVGRAIYFAPTNFLLFNNSPWRAVKMTQREPPHDVGRLNALAGLIWAVVLVNIRHPEILESLLRCHGAALPESDAFSHGVSSATMVWLDSTEDDSRLDALCRHQPERSNRALNKAWTEQICHTFCNALERFYPVIKEHNCWGEVFRYQSLPELVVRLAMNKN